MKINVAKNLILLKTIPENCDYEIAGNVTLTFILLADKPWDHKPDLRFTLKGDGARLDFLSLVVGKEVGHYDFRTEVVHSAKHTTSRQKVKAAMFGSSSTDFDGMTLIGKDADFSDAYMTHKALLMSPGTKSNALPSLEILANEVKAGHSSSTGKPDKEALFYLMSRGIPESRANALLVESFFAEMADSLPDCAEKETMLRWLKTTIRL